MGMNYAQDEVDERLEDRRQVLRAAWRAIDASVPTDLRPGPSPNFAKLALEAVDLRSAYLSKWGGGNAFAEIRDGDNVLVRGSRSPVR